MCRLMVARGCWLLEREEHRAAGRPMNEKQVNVFGSSLCNVVFDLGIRVFLAQSEPACVCIVVITVQMGECQPPK